MEHSHIERDPAVMAGKPVIAGTFITVEHILDSLGAGEPIQQLLEAHPRLTPEGIQAAVRYGAEAVRSEFTLQRRSA